MTNARLPSAYGPDERRLAEGQQNAQMDQFEHRTLGSLTAGQDERGLRLIGSDARCQAGIQYRAAAKALERSSK
jgi:hypothetical protein